MPIAKLIEITAGKGINTGVFPSAEDTAGGWGDARNAWFKDLHIEHLPGQQKIVSMLSGKARALAQAYVYGNKMLYFEDGGNIFYIVNGTPPAQVIGTLDSSSNSFWLETYGGWLIASDNSSQLQLWSGGGTFAPIAVGQFKTAKIVKKLAQHVIAYSTDVLPTGFHWCSASNPNDWTPTVNNSARNLPIRNLDSDIICVTELNGGHAVYSHAYMLQVSYLGPDLGWFGTPAAPLNGIGAESRYSVVSLGRFNWGLTRAGVFFTDGQSFQYVDTPAVDSWVQDTIDWARANEIVGYFDERLYLVCWSVPLLAGGKSVLAVDPKDRVLLTDKSKRPFTFATGDYGAALHREVMDYPIVGKADGLYFTSVNGTTMGDFYLQGGLYDAGDHSLNKTWEIAKFEGTIAGAQVRFGFTDQPHLDSVEWQDWSNMTFEFPLPGGPRESIYLAIEMKSTQAFRLSGFTMWGLGAGKAT